MCIRDSLKTGFNHALLHWPDSIGVVTLDADGQHLPEDVEAVGRALDAEPNRLVLGCRSFHRRNRDIPWRSRWGNRATCLAMRLFTGLAVSDTPVSYTHLSRLSKPGRRCRPG